MPKYFEPLNYTDLTKNRQPDFNNILKILKKEKPNRHTLFEFFLNDKLYRYLAGTHEQMYSSPFEHKQKVIIPAFRNAGYDYCTMAGSDFEFPNKTNNHGLQSISVNADILIEDEKTYNAYKWPNPENFDYSILKDLQLPDGMKFIVNGPCGVLENVTFLTGYDNLCYLIVDEPDLVERIFDDVGSRLLKYYEICLEYDSVGAIISNDDWGFNTQTMLSVSDMRKYVFPWHKRIVEAAHRANRPVILHSCGYFGDVLDDIAKDMKYDGRHSYEDKIIPVEEAYDKYRSKFAIMGGIDVDFVCRATKQEIYDRSLAMLDKAEQYGGYALGTGNSVPDYIPWENYFAMNAAALLN